jgi:hypothetical protein
MSSDVHSHPAAGPSMQEILDRTAIHLYNQNKRSWGPIHSDPWLGDSTVARIITGPRYKTDDAREQCYCSVGPWFNKEYHPSIEGKCLLDLLAEKEYHSHVPSWIKKSWFDKRCHKVDLLNELQAVHDCTSFWEDDGTAGPRMAKELKRLARVHSLKVKTINTLWETGEGEDVKVAKKQKKKDGSKKSKRLKSR